MDRQTFANVIPLVAVLIALAEYFFDHTTPRYAGPWFWIALVATIALLVAVQLLRFAAARERPSKPDYSATTLIRRGPDERG